MSELTPEQREQLQVATGHSERERIAQGIEAWRDDCADHDRRERVALTVAADIARGQA